VLAAADEIDEARAVVTIAAPAEPVHVETQFGDNLDAIHEQGELEVKLAGRPFRIKKQFLEDLETSVIRRRVETLRRALLVMHSPVDKIVNVDNAREIYQAAKHPKSFISLDDADHLLTRRSDAQYAASVLAAWAQRYLPVVDEAKPLENDQVEVSETGLGKLGNQVRAGRHVMAADEPKRLGGTDTGPTPYDYLLAGLGACTAMTLRLYAERKELALDKVSVRLYHQRIHADDCSDCESTGGQISEIHRDIRLEGDLSDQDRAKLLQIADKCPVHRTLENEIKVRTQLAQDKPASSSIFLRGKIVSQNQPNADYSDIKAVFINTSLKKDGASSHTRSLLSVSERIMEKNNAQVEHIHLLDHQLAFGVQPDMTEHGWDRDDWPQLWKQIGAAEILVVGTPIWLGEESSVCRLLIERLYSMSGLLNDKGQSIFYGKTGGAIVTGNEDGIKHSSMTILYALQHLGYTIPPQADCGWIGEAGPGPSFGDESDAGPVGFDNEFTQRNTTIMTWNLLHMARMLKDAGGLPSYGNDREAWKAGSRFDHQNPEYRS
jgi:uncharacterized OsmC-like protein/multimeric flavodoxin WrbA